MSSKSKLYFHLDNQMSLVKTGTMVKTKKLEELSKKIKNLKDIMEVIDFRNKNMYNDNTFLENNYLHDSKVISDLHENLNVKTVDEIINIFQTVSAKYLTSYSLVRYYN